MEVIAWCFIFFGALSMIVWYFLKAFGVINSPVWVEIFPVLGGGASVIGVAYLIGYMKNTLDTMYRKVDRLDSGMIKMFNRVNKVEDVQDLCRSGELRGSPYSVK